MNEMWQHSDKISQKASYYLNRTKLIQGNIANADTPNYKPKELRFEQLLTEQTTLKKEHPRHIGLSTESKVRLSVTELENVSGNDRNRVNVEEELAKLAESSIMYKSMVETMKKEFSKLKLVINGG